MINNPRKNYGNATIAEPCVKCLIEAIQSDNIYKAKVGTAEVDYVVNYIKSVIPQDTLTETRATNALRVDIVDKNLHSKKIATYIYDNAASKLLWVDKTRNNSPKSVAIDENLPKKIRNSCYWGVASGK